MTIKVQKPTAAELEILQILWETNPETVRFVHEQINRNKNVGYTTTLKILQNMAAKKLVTRKQKGRVHLYIPLLKKEETREILLNKFLDAAFGGSASSLVMQALGNNRATLEELKQIKAYIQKLEGNK
ncbi:MAG: BlaI/MecI/CopY family transcriptional regulator [Bacteroidales bacterium]